MGDGGNTRLEVASFKVSGFSDILDWRPMLFQEPIIAPRACVVCGVVYKKAVRLPCLHTMCVKCQAQCIDKGSKCPVDQKPFDEKDVEQLKTSHDYILRREVACWNAPRGCVFIGPAARLLDHYRECDFGVVSCCMCHSPVLQGDILDHFKNGCSIHKAAHKSFDDHATQGLKDVSRACLQMKKAMGKISEDLMSLQTSLNCCREDIRAEDAKFKGLWEAEASRLTGLLKELSTVCTTGFAEELRVLQAARADYRELCSQLGKLTMVPDPVGRHLLGHHKPVKVHWYVEGWALLKKHALEGKPRSWEGPTRSMYDYSVSLSFELERKKDELECGCYMHIHPGDHDFQLEWPFRRVFTIGIIHPEDHSKVISDKTKPGEDGDLASFQRPKGRKTVGYGDDSLSTAEELEKEGFIQNDKLHLFLEIEP